MKKYYIFLSIFAMLTISACSTSKESEYYGNYLDKNVDALHPSFFINVFEIPPNKEVERIPITIMRSIFGHREEVINAEVDISSKIRIQFNRDSFNGSPGGEEEITITGTKNNQKIEIPGYSEIGEVSKTSSIKISSAIELFNSLKEIERIIYNKNFYEKAKDFFSNKDLFPRNEIITILEDRDSSRKEVNGMTELISRKFQMENSIRDYSFQIQKFSAGEFLARNKQKEYMKLVKADSTYDDSVKNVENYIKKITLQKDSLLAINNNLETNVNVLNEQIEKTDQLVQLKGKLKAEYFYIKDFLFRNKGYILTLFRQFANQNNINAIRAVSYALKSPRSYHLVMKEATDIENIWFKKFENSSTDSTLASLEMIIDALNNFVAMSDVKDRNDFINEVNNYTKINLKDTEIVLANLDTKPNDVIVIEIVNKFDNEEIGRTLRIRLIAKELGFVRKESASLIFIRPTQSDSVNFHPVPGVSLAWTWYPRAGDFWKSLARLFSPGVGINVSFINSKSNGLNFGAGITATFFDNSLIFNLGWDLTSQKRAVPPYIGVGFNFADLFKKFGE